MNGESVTEPDFEAELKPHIDIDKMLDKYLDELAELQIGDKDFEGLDLTDLAELDSLELDTDFTELEEELSKISKIDLSDFEGLPMPD